LNRNEFTPSLVLQFNVTVKPVLTLNKTESCINQTLSKVPVQEIFVNLSCISQNFTIADTKAGTKED